MATDLIGQEIDVGCTVIFTPPKYTSKKLFYGTVTEIKPKTVNIAFSPLNSYKDNCKRRFSEVVVLTNDQCTSIAQMYLTGEA